MEISNKPRVVSCRCHKSTDSAGNRQVRYEVGWSNGTVEEFGSKKELPREVRVFMSGYVAAAQRNCRSWFGLGWDHEPDRLTISWPTFHWMKYVFAMATLGLVPIAGWMFHYGYEQQPMGWLPIALAVCLFAILLVPLLDCFVRSRLQFDRSMVRQWTNYGFFVRREEWPRKNVLEAIVAIIPVYQGERRRAHVSFQIRIRRESGIEWRSIGGNFARWKARSLPRELRRFVKVRTESE